MRAKRSVLALWACSDDGDRTASATAGATAGIPLALSFDPAIGAFSYRYAARSATGPTEIFAPRRHYPNGYDVVVLGGRILSAPGADLVLVETSDGATEVTVTLTATP